MSVTAALFVGLVVALVGRTLVPSLPVLWWVAAASLPLFQLGELGLGIAQGIGQNRWYLATYVSQPLALFALSLSAAALVESKISPSPIAWAEWLVVVPVAVRGGVALIAATRLPGARYTDLEVAPVLSYTARFYPTTLAHFLSYRLDLMLVGALLGPVSAGTYSLAMNGLDAVARIGQSAATVLYPRFASQGERQGATALARQVALSTGAVAATLQLILAAVLFWLAAEGSEVIHTIAVLSAILVIGGGSLCAWTVLASFLAAQGDLGTTARISAALLGISVILYLTLIPSIGVYGGALGTSAGLAVAAVLSYRAALPSSESTADERRLR
jgi:O-antigen/teichoic acid export membrane protein